MTAYILLESLLCVWFCFVSNGEIIWFGDRKPGSILSGRRYPTAPLDGLMMLGINRPDSKGGASGLAGALNAPIQTTADPRVQNTRELDHVHEG